MVRILGRLLVLGSLGVLGFGAYAYLTQFQGSHVAPLALSSPAAGTPAGAGAPAGLAGSWKISDGSVVGYRVREKFASVPAASDAVGRTSAIDGSLEVIQSGSGFSVSSGSFTVDLTTVASNRPQRDQNLQHIGLESATYPKSQLVLTAPVPLPGKMDSGSAVSFTVKGNFTLHGTTKLESIPMQARLSGSAVEIVGSITFPFEQFGMHPPSSADIVTVDDQATMEFDLHLQRA
jgi:polyisoprenoid-binding protein YceI